MPKIYDFGETFDFVTDYFRKLKLKMYKKKKVKKSTTRHTRHYHIKYRIVVEDDHNPQTSEIYETVVPARAVFFAKILLTRSVKAKIALEFDSFEELSDEEYEHHLDSKAEYVKTEQARMNEYNTKY